MKVGFAVEANEGIEGKEYSHFGSAPLFIIVDAATEEITIVNNKDLNHAHGACNPVKALDGRAWMRWWSAASAPAPCRS